LISFLFFLCFGDDSCQSQLFTDGEPMIFTRSFRANTCLTFDATVVPVIYSFTATAHVSVSHFAANSKFTDFTLMSIGTTPSVPSTGLLSNGSARIVFSFPVDTTFTLSYASFVSFNCSTMFFFQQPIVHSESVFGLDFLEPTCLFYGSPGVHHIFGSISDCRPCPAISVYSGMKHQLGTFSIVQDFDISQSSSHIPTFLTITPPRYVPGNNPKVSFTIETDDNSSANTARWQQFVGPTLPVPEPICKKTYGEEWKGITALTLELVAVILMTSYIMCKETRWCHRGPDGCIGTMIGYEEEPAIAIPPG
jgi:hypothetical protein